MITWTVKFRLGSDEKAGYPSWYRGEHSTYTAALHEAQLLADWAGIPLGKMKLVASGTGYNTGR